MNLTAVKIFGGARAARYALDKQAHVLLQARCKSKITTRKAIETNRYQRSEDSIGLYGYCLLASNATQTYLLHIIFLVKICTYHSDVERIHVCAT